MRKFLRYLLRIAGAVLCLLFLFWLGLAGYVEWKKDSLLEKARTAINSRINGKLHIGNMEVSLFRHFPTVMIRLTDVTLQDTAWYRHRHDLLRAAQIDIGCAPIRSLLRGRIGLNTVSVEHGTVWFYTDSMGYGNTSIFLGKKGQGMDNLPVIRLTDVRWVMEKQDRHKFFDLTFRRLRAVITTEDRTLHVDINTVAKADSFAFNTAKGSFIAGQQLEGHFGFTYNLASHILQVPKARLSIGGHPFVFSGRFFPTVRPDPFFLTVDADRIPYRQAAAMLTPHLHEKLDEYDIDKPVSIHAQLDAGAADEQQPQIQVRLNLEGCSVLTPTASFTGVTFQAVFTNEWVRGQERGDENSAIRFTAFSGQLAEIPLRADSLLITNLIDPQLSCDLHSHFELAGLNDLFGSETLQFSAGSCRMDLRYKGPLSETDSAGATVNGQLDLDSAGVLYLPYRFGLTNINGRLLFRDQDLVVEHLSARAGKTSFRIKGIAKNLIVLLDHNTEDVSMDWSLNAPHLALEDFAVLAGPSGQGSGRRSRAAAFGTTAARIDHFLKDGLIHVRLDAADISYEDFAGAHARAELTFQDHEIRVSNVRVAQDSGTLELTAELRRRPESGQIPITVESRLTHVDLPLLFRSFDNFGQEGITSNNLKGKIDADINMTALLSNRAKIVPNSFKGQVDFTITDGQLVNFPPMEKIHEKVLKKRDLSDIRFAPLENRLDIDSTTLFLHRMEIRSTAFTLYAEGTYDLKKGTDMSLQVPLSNLKSRDSDIPPESRGNDSRAGLSVRLRARSDEHGKLTISWDPFRKALKTHKKA